MAADPIPAADSTSEVLRLVMQRDGTLLVNVRAKSETDVDDVIDFLKGVRSMMQHRADRAAVALTDSGP